MTDLARREDPIFIKYYDNVRVKKPFTRSTSLSVAIDASCANYVLALINLPHKRKENVIDHKQVHSSVKKFQRN